MTTRKITDFTKSYSVLKTLRFSLIPQGKTLDFIKAGAFLSEDEKRAEAYKEMKNCIDAYHVDFIEKSMNALKVSAEAEKERQEEAEQKKNGNEKPKEQKPITNFTYKLLEGHANKYEDFKKSKQNFYEEKNKAKETYKKSCKELREKLNKASFNSAEMKEKYKDLFKKELIQKHLEEFVHSYNQEKLDTTLIFNNTFKKFTTYFTGFHENRKNMYSTEEQSTAIAYRIIDENFPKYHDNREHFKKHEILIHNCIDMLNQENKQFLIVNGLEDFSSIEKYIDCFSQSGIERYNRLIGGQTLEGSVKLQGLNEIINLYNQKCSNKTDKIARFKVLYKQILSDRETLSFLPQAFTDTNEMYESIKTYYYGIIYEKKHSLAPLTGNLISELEILFQELKNNSFNTAGIYLNKESITKISSTVFKRYDFLYDALEYFYKNDSQFKYETKLKKAKSIKAQEDLEKQVDNFVKASYIPLQTLQNAIESYTNTLEELSDLKDWKITNYFVENFKVITKEKDFSFLARLDSLYSSLKGEFEDDLHSSSYKSSKEIVYKIKFFLDTCMELLHYTKALSIKRKDQLETDILFYERLNPILEELAKIIPLYDKVRNFCTKKPYSVEKFKLTFTAPTLCDGWDENQERKNCCTLLKRNGKYYLAILDSEKAKSEKKKRQAELKKNNMKKEGANPSQFIIPDSPDTNEQDYYEKIIYKLSSKVYMNIPKNSLISSCTENDFENSEKSKITFDPSTFNKPLLISKEVFNLYKNTLFKKEHEKEENYLEHLKSWIDFCLDFLQSYKSTAIYDYTTIIETKYHSLQAFYNDLDQMLYSIRFENVSTKQVDELVNRGEVLLFEIHNKDFNAGSTGTPNIHTLYWKALFNPENLEDVVLKLGGEAELFYRKASIKDENIFIHKKGEKLVNKTTKNGATIPDGIYREICQIVEGKISLHDVDTEVKDYYEQSTIKIANHDIIKDKRYTQDTFLFHVPITINYKQPEPKDFDLNGTVSKYIKDNQEINVIGIDRGERHLLYITVINQQGDILEQLSLNNINGTDYHKKLDIREKERDKSRKNWENIGKIAELKEGYLSHVVHKIAQLIIKYNAIVVLEDLNFGFKRGRFKIEKQVYQKFEKALITKLNYLCFKGTPLKESGGILNGLQLTNKFESFSKIGKQNGILFYLAASNTSKIDPVTGFVDRIPSQYKKYSNIKNAQEFFQKFDSIVYNKNSDAFEFTYKEKEFVESSSQIWTLTTLGETRFLWDQKANNNKEDTKTINVTEELKKAFSKATISFENGENLKDTLAKQENVELFKNLLFCLNLILRMRYSNPKTEQDFMLSPVLIEGEKVFCSEEVSDTLPQNADANGAYNIARKGLLMLEQVNAGESNPLIIRNQTWFEYAQRNDIVTRQIEKLK